METKLQEEPRPNLTAAKKTVSSVEVTSIPESGRLSFTFEPAEAGCSLRELVGGLNWLRMRSTNNSAFHPVVNSATDDGQLQVSMSSSTFRLIRERVLLEGATDSPSE